MGFVEVVETVGSSVGGDDERGVEPELVVEVEGKFEFLVEDYDCEGCVVDGGGGEDVEGCPGRDFRRRGSHRAVN